MKASELKKLYIDFFKSKGHAVIESNSLVPEHDPTVLFTTAGMHPLVPYILGQKHPLGKRLVNVQKCLRTDDINEIGDYYHHTFFEMLGNWSLGDYFKIEAIEYSFEFLTEILKIPLNKLAITCFAGDDDSPKDEVSANVWKALGISEERIVFLGKKHNWWGPPGATGPCGPDTEMFYWADESKPPEKFDPEDDRWVEIWNDVFIQYEKTSEGKYIPLKQKCVDTGLGVERVSAVLQGYMDNYKTELFWPIIEKIQELTKKDYQDNKKIMRIIADHTRAAVFILGDERDVVPSNVDQGYILRRLVRRVIRHMKMLGCEKSMSILAGEVISIYQTNYSSLNSKKEYILGELEKEETKFQKTLEKGLKEFEKITENSNELLGKDAFLLFQSYGFPIELTKELCNEQGIILDKKGFEREYEKHQMLSRVGAEQKFKGGLSEASDETKKLHTATHLLNEALRRVLSSDIKQKGSNINSKRLRFDFNFDRKLTEEEIKRIEDEINRIIGLNLPITAQEMPLQKALDSGAQAEFGAKYPDVVTVYYVGDYSKEICMGPHVENTKDLGSFKILKEESSAAGIRRIKAVLE
ncbi:alanine--tRNA ligase [Candidatus Micrarchaeota archaeon]|nr:alanine--tRNA ligase [Candidatus Micrarchaeota archaeon]